MMLEKAEREIKKFMEKREVSNKAIMITATIILMTIYLKEVFL